MRGDVRGMSRRPLDFYPTPPDVVKAVERWLDGRLFPIGGPWLDPAAGAGALLAGVRRFGSPLVAYELDEMRREVLEGCADEVTVGDALEMEGWHPRANVIANPPYNLLEPFVERIVKHCRRDDALGLVLTRLQWLDDGDDRHVRFRPDAVLRMPWRVSFTGDGRTEATTHAWLVYLPNRAIPRGTVTEWLRRPVVSSDAWEHHRNLAGSVPQLHMFEELET